MSSTQYTERQEQAIRRVVERATANPEARQLALRDARAAVQEYGGAELPAGGTVTFIERAPNLDALIVMSPSGTSADLGNVSDEERKLFGAVLTRATNDSEFRTLAANDARAAIKAATGYEIQPHVKIAFYDQPSTTDIVAVLPPFVAEGAELSEAELEMVAGGWCICSSCCVSGDIHVG